MDLDPPTPVEIYNARRRMYWWLLWLIVILGVIYYLVFVNEYVVAHDDDREHFKYGSIGSEPVNGLPYWVFKALPAMYADELGSGGYRTYGLLYEGEDADLPIGVSRRVVTGVERVWLNCSVCHVGTYRETASGPRNFVLGAPSNNLRLMDFVKFLLKVGADPKLNADNLIAAIESEQVGGDLNIIEKLIYRFIVVPEVRVALRRLAGQLAFIHRQQDWGPGRVDTFNPYKAIQFNFPMGPDDISKQALDGSSDYPSIWQQGPREGMNLHWDGNNDSVAERNLSAALGAGVTPTTVDIDAIKRIEGWLDGLSAPKFPFEKDIDQKAVPEGRRLFADYCAGCHGMTVPAAAPCGQKATISAEPATVAPDTTGDDPSAASNKTTYPWSEDVYCYDTNRFVRLGQVETLADIGTDPGRWASYTEPFAGAQNLLYSGYPWRFKRFRKTNGYANHPLDGIWARSPYLHNGSVPTLRDLLEPANKRPTIWTRGSDVFDLDKVGYRSDGAGVPRERWFIYDTSVDGNKNTGHVGKAYGTDLSDDQKDAIVEYMKTL